MTEEDYDIMLAEEEDMIRKLSLISECEREEDAGRYEKIYNGKTVLHSTTFGRTEKPDEQL